MPLMTTEAQPAGLSSPRGFRRIAKRCAQVAGIAIAALAAAGTAASFPGRHLTMIASPHQVAAAIDSLGS